MNDLPSCILRDAENGTCSHQLALSTGGEEAIKGQRFGGDAKLYT